MVNTYGQDIDAMWEADTAAAWEDLNDVPEEEEEEETEHPWDAEWYPAIYKLKDALRMFHKAETLMHEAAQKVVGSAAEDRIESLAMSAESLSDFVQWQIDLMEGE